MPNTLEDFLTKLGKILNDIYSARNILFRKTFREKLKQTNTGNEWEKKIQDLKDTLNSATPKQKKNFKM